MDPLGSELVARGVLDRQSLDFAQAYRSKHAVTIDGALLELDLVDEEQLLAGLESCYKMRALRREDIARADPEVGKEFNQSLAKSFGVCPLCFEDGAVVCLVKGPLPDELALELLELFGLIVRPRVAPEHYFELVRATIYGTAASKATTNLEARLSRRRKADVRLALEKVEGCSSLGAAAEQVIAFAQELLDFSCLLVFKNQRLRVAVAAGGQLPAGTTLPLPEADCPLRAAILHRGYFLGPLTPTPGARHFYESLHRPLPRWSLVAPVPSSGDASVVFCADNGRRGMALRTVAELALLIGRVRGRGAVEIGRRERRQPAPPRVSSRIGRAVPAAAPPAELPRTAAAAKPPLPAAPALTAEEAAALDRLREAAGTAKKSLTVFVDELLQQASQPRADPSTALGAEVKDLFQKLATDIPAHFARGIEGAFRELVPRLAAMPQPAPALGGAPQFGGAPPPPAAAHVELVLKAAGPREVPDYQSRRRKTTRTKL